MAHHSQNPILFYRYQYCNAIDENGVPTGQPIHSSEIVFSDTVIEDGIRTTEGLITITAIESAEPEVLTHDDLGVTVASLVNGKVPIEQLPDAILIPQPPATGTAILQSIDGILKWI